MPPTIAPIGSCPQFGCGLDDCFIRCRVRQREWAPLHRGVYVDHTGTPTWRQRAWGAVLHCWPAGLADESALIAHGLRPEDPAKQRREAGASLASRTAASPVVPHRTGWL